jgi:hypothetical protein
LHFRIYQMLSRTFDREAPDFSQKSRVPVSG